MEKLDRKSLLASEIKTLIVFSILWFPIFLLVGVGGSAIQCDTGGCNPYDWLFGFSFYFYVIGRIIYIGFMLEEKLAKQKKFSQWFTVIAFFIPILYMIISFIVLASNLR
jgi:hypothetical protein